MLRQIRQTIIKNLWNNYQKKTPHVRLLETHLKKKGLNYFFLDHFALIDLPGPQTGIKQLSQIFSMLGYELHGSDYLPCKQNDFSWMRETDCLNLPVKDVLPQVVVADFRLDELPPSVNKIILKYSQQSKSFPVTEIKKFINDAITNKNLKAADQCIQLINLYLSGRDWPLPTTTEFFTVHEFNELLAWVLIFGRRPNHFTLAIHLLSHFKDLEHFNQFIENELKLILNCENGRVKGGKEIGIAQSSTMGLEQKVKLQDDFVTLRTEFIEFVWRYPLNPKDNVDSDSLWKNFFTGFVADHANNVIESLA